VLPEAVRERWTKNASCECLESVDRFFWNARQKKCREEFRADRALQRAIPPDIDVAAYSGILEHQRRAARMQICRWC